MSLNRQEFTNGGRNMLGRANNGERLVIENVAIGSGQANQPSDLWPLTALINPQMRVPITRQADLGDGILLLDVAFNSSQATARFELREVGVRAGIGNETARLYSVANAFATGVDVVDPAVESIHAFKIKVVIDRATDVTVIIGESGDILAENIGAETIGGGLFKEKILNTLRFKRLTPGDNIQLIENPVDPFDIKVNGKITSGPFILGDTVDHSTSILGSTTVPRYKDHPDRMFIGARSTLDDHFEGNSLNSKWTTSADALASKVKYEVGGSHLSLAVYDATATDGSTQIALRRSSVTAPLPVATGPFQITLKANAVLLPPGGSSGSNRHSYSDFLMGLERSANNQGAGVLQRCYFLEDFFQLYLAIFGNWNNLLWTGSGGSIEVPSALSDTGVSVVPAYWRFSVNAFGNWLTNIEYSVMGTSWMSWKTMTAAQTGFGNATPPVIWRFGVHAKQLSEILCEIDFIKHEPITGLEFEHRLPVLSEEEH